MIFECLSNTQVINPYAHFGQPLIWPRGYPLSQIGVNHKNSYRCGKRKTSTIQQGVVNGDPDVDAIYRLTKAIPPKIINLRFDNSTPSIQYPNFIKILTSKS